MATAYKTPGVYIVEKDAFSNSVVEVATAVPAFIGYTEKAEYKGNSLLTKPWRITSLAEYITCFGGAPLVQFTLDDKGIASAPAIRFRMYNSLLHFFQNGGGACYIVSIGAYGEVMSAKDLAGAITLLEKEQEPTLVLVPEAVSLATVDECADVQNAILSHCAKMKNRFGILDVYNGFDEPVACISAYREKLTNNLHLGAAYYPWLKTTLVSSEEVSFLNFKDLAALQKLLDAAVPAEPAAKALEIKAEIAKLATADKVPVNEQLKIHRTLVVISPKYVQLLQAIRDQLNLQPPSAAVAGIYTMVDNSVGVWKAPANVGVNGVIAPTINLTNEEQEDLNVPTNGKAINAIRAFKGDGNIVWGARTLDGNSLDWRYVNVRRTMIMLEESIKLAAKAYVFEPNVANTWVSISSMISSFLNGIWKRGGLAGAVPADAYGVFVGLGQTMTPDDILEGYLRVTVKVALVRPAEFIEITFQQQQQKS